MESTTIKERLNLTEDVLFEDNTTDNGMTDEELKVEALKIATNIGKLMNNVTTEDIVNIAETVAKFIKNGDSSETSDLETMTPDDDTSSEESEESEDFVTDEDTEDQENASAENESEETTEDFEI